MARMAPQELATKTGGGLLSFPVTHFKQDFAFDEGPYREHIEWLLQYGPAGLFAAGGTGEFFSLTMPEFGNVVSAAVRETEPSAAEARISTWPLVVNLMALPTRLNSTCRSRVGSTVHWPRSKSS